MFTTIDALHRPRRTTALMRALALLFLAALVFATLFPMSGWTAAPHGPLGFVLRGLPRWWTWFDVLGNLLAYVLLGLMLALAWFERVPTGRTVLLMGGACCLLSLTLEAAQSYLPARVPSLLDWIANSAGGVAGSLLGALLNRTARRSDRLALPMPERWYEQGAPSGWVLLILWLATQLVPERLLFATGQWRPMLQHLIDSLMGPNAPDLAQWLDRLWNGPTPAATGVAVEAAVVVCAVCVIGSLAFALVKGSRRRLALLAAIAAVALGLRSIATQLVYGADEPFAWLTPGAQGGLVVGAALLYALETLSARARAICAMVLCTAGWLLVNFAPEDRYFESTLAGVRAGQLVNVQGLLRIIGMLWPVAALAWFMPLGRRPARRWL